MSWFDYCSIFDKFIICTEIVFVTILVELLSIIFILNVFIKHKNARLQKFYEDVYDLTSISFTAYEAFMVLCVVWVIYSLIQ